MDRRTVIAGGVGAGLLTPYVVDNFSRISQLVSDNPLPNASTAIVYADTYPNLQRAIDATPLGGTLYLPVGDYPLSGSGVQLLYVSRSITIRGEGAGSRILVDASVPNSCDVIRVAGPIEGMQLCDFAIMPASGRPARYGIVFDATGGSNHISGATLARLSIGRFGAEGLALYGPRPPAFDGVFSSAVTECLIQGGMLLERAGDSLTITGNTFSNGGGITVNLIGNGSNTAHGFVFMFNNVTSSEGIKVLNSWQGAISYNNIEMYEGGSGSNGAVIDFEGNPSIPPEGFEIRGNYIGSGTASIPISIRVNHAKGLRIEGNTLPRAIGGKTIVLTTNADRTQIFYNREQPYGELIGSWLLDNGTNTVVAYIHPNTGRLTLPYPTDLGALRIGGGAPVPSSNGLLQYVGEIVTTASVFNHLLDARISTGSIALAVPYNSTAAAMTGVYASAGEGHITLIHPPVPGGGFSIFSTINPPG